MRTTRLILSLSLVGALVACSGDDGLSAEEQEFADAWAATLEDDEDGFSAGAEEAACMADAIMAELGTGPFEDADVTAGDITVEAESNSPGEVLGEGVVTDAQANAILDVWEDDCTDLVALLSESAVDQFDLDADGEACFAEGLAQDDLARDFLVPSFTSGDDTPPDAVVTALLELLDSCGSEGDSSIADSIATSLAADGQLTEEQAQCVAEEVVDSVGVARLTELTAGGSFEDADPADQEELASALLDAAGACDVPVSAFGG